ncbi:DeoR/GlpR transcriptional regulator, partial [Paenibacillus sepulcri]|nr:DeoR/GlpR transcriptional regulator [Paenibacillus sepulcri]
IKRMFIEASRRVICVADHSKFDKGALFTFATLTEVERIITDDGLDSSIMGKYQALQVNIEQADRSGNE